MKTNGFTLIELVIVIVIIGIFSAIVLPLIIGKKNTKQRSVEPTPSYVAHCIDATKWIEDTSGKMTQIIGADGKPIACSRY